MSEEKKDQQNDHPWGELNEHYHGEGPLPPARKVRTSRIVIWLLVVACILVAVLVIGLITRSHQKHTLKDETNAQAAPTVVAVHPKQQAMTQELTLPSNMQPYMDAPIYARTSGYLGKWYYDIGAHVKKGALLAKVESPEVDQQLAQAQAELQNSIATAKLGNITAERYSALLKTDAVAKQDVDNAVQQAAAQNATVKSQQSNVDRLRQLVGFELVQAPFTGIVTARNTDVGQLVNAGNGGTAVQELFHMQDIHVLRVFVNVPQSYALDSKPGSPAYVTLDLFPNQKFWGKIARTANSIDVASRTLNVEVDVDNADGKLYAGTYAVVHIPLHEARPTLTIPVSALMFRQEGLRVATIENNDTVKMVKIVPGRDYGTEIEVVSGLEPGQEVITDPPDSAVDGSKVRLVQPGQNNGKGGEQGSSRGNISNGASGNASGNSDSSSKSNSGGGGKSGGGGGNSGGGSGNSSGGGDNGNGNGSNGAKGSQPSGQGMK